MRGKTEVTGTELLGDFERVMADFQQAAAERDEVVTQRLVELEREQADLRQLQRRAAGTKVA
jgi:hypothetical protein